MKGFVVLVYSGNESWSHAVQPYTIIQTKRLIPLVCITTDTQDDVNAYFRLNMNYMQEMGREKGLFLSFFKTHGLF